MLHLLLMFLVAEMYVMLISNLIVKRNSKIKFIVIPVYFIYLRIISQIIHYGHFRLRHTFLDSIFAVYCIALCPVRILIGMCFVGTPSQLSVDFDWATPRRTAWGLFQLVPNISYCTIDRLLYIPFNCIL